MSSIGAILPMTCGFTRNAADVVALFSIRLENRGIVCSVNGVVEALPQGAETLSLIRYPSPEGRLCALWCKPPTFLFGAAGRRDRRSFAVIGSRVQTGFDDGRGLALSVRKKPNNKIRGKLRCSRFLQKPWQSRPLSACRPAAIQFLNRLFWGAAPERSQARSLAAVSLPVQLSARQGTSSIARPTQAAANLILPRTGGAEKNNQTIGALPRAGGFLHAGSARNVAWPRTKRRDERCSRRS